MNNKFFLILIFLLLIPVSFAISLQDLINFFNFDFFTSEINVTSYNDMMFDKDSNGANDTLAIELTTDGNAGEYLVSIDLHDNNIVTNETNLTLNSGTNKFNITFPTDFFTKNKFNYTIKIYESNYSLKYSKEDIETQTYSNYETGISILSINESLTGGLQLSFTINTSKEKDYEFVAYLRYNDSVIFSKTNVSLSSGMNKVLVNFSNETIKKTHYLGSFNLTAIKFDHEIIRTNYSTSSYNYQDFATTSYLASFSENGIDNNDNALYDSLEITALIDSKESGIYNLEMYVYDLFDKYLSKLEKNQTLDKGTENIILYVNGTEIYEKKLNGPFVIKNAKLSKNNETLDIIDEFYFDTGYNYTNFEKPPLPDINLTLTISDEHNFGINNVEINISLNNIGNRVAFNVFLETFDNNSYSKNETLNILQKEDSKVYSFTFQNISDFEFISIADFEDFVEESDETNNVVKETIVVNSAPSLQNISSITVNETSLITINATASDKNDEVLVYSMNNSHFSKNNNVFSWKTTTMDAGNYSFKLNVSDGFLADKKEFRVEILDLKSIDLDDDGINDSLDKVFGNNESINTSIEDLGFFIGNSTNLSRIVEGKQTVEFKQQSSTLVEFDLNFSLYSLNLSKIVMEKQSGNDTGFAIFNIGNISLPEDFTKTIYIDKLNLSQNGICIKDAEITSIDEVSSSCTSENEHKIECDGTLQDGYNCAYIASNSNYAVSGLKNSGVKQIEYEQAATSSETTSSSTSSNSGSGSSSGGSCKENWECSEWPVCQNKSQFRTCYDKNNCKTEFNKPIESKDCEVAKEILTKKHTLKKKINNKNNELKFSLPSITGFLLAPPEDAKPSTGVFVILFIMGIGLFSYFSYLYKEDN